MTKPMAGKWRCPTCGKRFLLRIVTRGVLGHVKPNPTPCCTAEAQPVDQIARRYLYTAKPIDEGVL